MADTPDLLIHGGTIIDPASGAERRADVLIRNGRIETIGDDIDAGSAERFDASGMYLSPGWLDMHVHLREPGYEHKETIETGCAAASLVCTCIRC